ncbi:hypothetical protein MC885_000430 [Smutsia gigantea]|nr:hypothetical protein MC885_000430 [Smutsia gigantea]
MRYLSPISNENAKDIKKPLVTGSKDPSATQGNSEDQGSSPSETKPVVSMSFTELVYVAADLLKLQEEALEDTQTSLSAYMPALSDRIIRDLSESCFGFLKSALDVPRLYRRTNKVSAIH